MTPIDAYIEHQDENIKPSLYELRDAILSVIPEALEQMTYGIPTFTLSEHVIHFAVNKNHIGIYPTPGAVAFFKNELKSFKTTKGSFHIPLNQAIPFDLIKDIVLYRFKQIRNERG